MGVVKRVIEWADQVSREAAARHDLRCRMEEIDRQSDDLIEAGYYDEAEDLMTDRGKLFREYSASLRRSSGSVPGALGRKRT